MFYWQYIGIFLAASSVSIGFICVLAWLAPDGVQDEQFFYRGKLPNNFTDRDCSGSAHPASSSRVADVNSLGVGHDTYPATVLNSSFHKGLYRS